MPELPFIVSKSKMYLRCDNCGEVFDDIDAAVGHDGEDVNEQPCYDDHHHPAYSLVPEEEAF